MGDDHLYVTGLGYGIGVSLLNVGGVWGGGVGDFPRVWPV